ncbi:MAG: TAXI family TRAP transporter solute-binding subunit [Candidatus Wallbacteria bacterium]
MKKKYLIYILFFVMLFINTLAAGLFCECAAAANDNAASKLMVLVTGDQRGVYFYCGKRIEKILNFASKNMNLICRSTNGALENIRLVSSQNADCGFSQYDMLLRAQKGEAEFKGQKHDNLAVVTVLFPEVFTIVSREGVDSFAGLKGKSISTHLPGSGVRQNSDQLLEIAGLKNKVKIMSFNMKDAEKSFVAGEIDAFFTVIGMPSAAVINPISRVKNSQVIGLDEPIRKAAVEKIKGFVPYEIPVETYFNTQPVPTIATFAVLFARADADDASIKEILNTVYSLPDFSTKAGLTGKVNYFSKQNAKKFLSGMKDVKIHKAALEYFKDIK